MSLLTVLSLDNIGLAAATSIVIDQKGLGIAWEWGPSSINAGETAYWEFFWQEDQFPGIQVFQARPTEPPDTGAFRLITGGHLRISDVSFEWRVDIGYFYHFAVTAVGGWSPT